MVRFKPVALLLVLLMGLCWAPYGCAKVCYSKDDIGLGGEYNVPANPVDSQDNSIKLLRSKPQDNQVMSWINTNLVVDATSDKLKFYVDGSWEPWGGVFPSSSTCNTITPCTPGITIPGDPSSPPVLCVAGGMQVGANLGADNSFRACVIDSNSFGGGSSLYGLYGLIAIPDSRGNTADPNDPIYFDQLPSNLFRTFQILPDSKGFATITNTQVCTYGVGSSVPTCTPDTASSLGTTYPIAQGEIYLKIVDGHYQDNSGYYMVLLSAGAIKPMGVIASTIHAFEKTITMAADFINTKVSADLSFIEVTKAMLLLYITINGLMFAMGMIQTNVGELIKRLFKVGIIVTAISPDSFNFFNTYIFSFIQGGFTEFATLILNATQDPNNPLQVAFAVPKGQPPLSIYDQILDSITSPALNAKILSMMFYKYWFFFMIIIYIGIVFILMAVVKTVIMYVVAVMNMAILVTLFPFVIVMILFEVTKGFFDSWLKSFIANGMTVMFIYASLVIIMTLLFGLLQTMFNFQVCWDVVWRLKLGAASLTGFSFWKPSSYQDIVTGVSLLNVAAFLIISMMFNKFSDHIPTLADTISGGNSGVGAGAKALIGSAASVLKKMKVMNPTSRILKQAGIGIGGAIGSMVGAAGGGMARRMGLMPTDRSASVGAARGAVDERRQGFSAKVDAAMKTPNIDKSALSGLTSSVAASEASIQQSNDKIASLKKDRSKRGKGVIAALKNRKDDQAIEAEQKNILKQLGNIADAHRAIDKLPLATADMNEVKAPVPEKVTKEVDDFASKMRALQEKTMTDKISKDYDAVTGKPDLSKEDKKKADYFAKSAKVNSGDLGALANIAKKMDGLKPPLAPVDEE